MPERTSALGRLVLSRYRRLLLLAVPFLWQPLYANETGAFSSNTRFLLVLGSFTFLSLFTVVIFLNRSYTRRARRRTDELLSLLVESNAQTRDLEGQLRRQKRLEQELLQRASFKRTITRLSSDFVRLGPREVDDGINRALRIIGEFSGVSRSYVFLLRQDGYTVDNTHEWCSEGVEPFREHLQGISLDDDIPWFGQQIREQREVYVPAINSLPRQAHKERKLFREQDIAAMFCIPLVSQDKLRGFLGFDWLGGERDWPEDIVQLLRIVGEIFTNALDRKKAEITLRESEERFRELADLLPQTIFELDLRMRVTYTNRHGFELTGYTPQDLTEGIEALDLFAPGERSRAKARMKHLVEQKLQTAANEYTCMRKDGTSFPAMIYSRAILRDERIVGFRGIMIDMTDRKRAEAEQRKLEARFLQTQKFESLSVMAGSIAHNFNNLLTVAIGNLEMCLTDIEPDAPYYELVRESQDAVIKAAELSAMMLTYVGKSCLDMVELELNKVIGDIEEILRVSVAVDGEVVYAKHPEPIHFKGDLAQIRQVIVNLVNNANEALEGEKGTITIRTGTFFHDGTQPDPFNQEMEQGEFVFLEVSDTGCGMDPKIMARVFDPFFTTKFTGRGLGLAAVLGIARAHKGGVSLHSEHGNGTTVKVMFPAIHNHAKPPEEHIMRDAEPFRGSGTVMLVDDEEMVRTVGQRMLQRLGFDVIEAVDGEDAVAQFKERGDEIDYILLDLTMPRLDGEETFHALREIDDEIPIMLITGYPEDQITDRFNGLGLRGFIRKPFNLKELGAKMKELVSS